MPPSGSRAKPVNTGERQPTEIGCVRKYEFRDEKMDFRDKTLTSGKGIVASCLEQMACVVECQNADVIAAADLEAVDAAI